MDTEHLLVFPDRDVAEEVGEELSARGLEGVRVVREALAGEDDSEAHEWAVHVVTPAVAPSGMPYAAELATLAADHGGWYDPDPLG